MDATGHAEVELEYGDEGWKCWEGSGFLEAGAAHNGSSLYMKCATQPEKVMALVSRLQEFNDEFVTWLQQWHSPDNGVTALMGACMGGHDELCARLVQDGLVDDVNAVDIYGGTAVYWCAYKGDAAVKCLAVIVANGGDVTIAKSSGTTPLEWAVRESRAEPADKQAAARATPRAEILAFLEDPIQGVLKHGSPRDLTTPAFVDAAGGDWSKPAFTNAVRQLAEDPGDHAEALAAVVASGSASAMAAVQGVLDAGPRGTRLLIGLIEHDVGDYLVQANVDFHPLQTLPFATMASLINDGFGDYLVQAGADLNATHGSSPDPGGRLPGSEKRDTLLHHFCKENHADAVRWLLFNGADVSAKTSGGKLAEELATDETIAQFFSVALAEDDHNNQLLCRRLPELAFAVGSQQRTALHRAAMGGAELNTGHLLAAGARVDVRDNGGRTPAHCATAAGSKGVLALLIAVGADVDAADASGCTPLLLAFACKTTALACMLIKAGADVNVANEHKCTPLFLATQAGDADLAKLLVQANADVDTFGKGGLTPLQWAVQRSNTALVRALVTAKADVDVVDSGNNTPLQLAVRSKHVELAEVLVRADADVNVLSSTRQPPLYEAIRGGNVDLVRLLVHAKGADVDLVGADKLTPLQRACKNGNANLVRVLLEANADATAAGADGTTPLHDATRAGDVVMMHLLLDFGADTSAATTVGTTPLQEASTMKVTLALLIHDTGIHPAFFDLIHAMWQVATPAASTTATRDHANKVVLLVLGAVGKMRNSTKGVKARSAQGVLAGAGGEPWRNKTRQAETSPPASPTGHAELGDGDGRAALNEAANREQIDDLITCFAPACARLSVGNIPTLAASVLAKLAGSRAGENLGSTAASRPPREPSTSSVVSQDDMDTTADVPALKERVGEHVQSMSWFINAVCMHESTARAAPIGSDAWEHFTTICHGAFVNPTHALLQQTAVQVAAEIREHEKPVKIRVLQLATGDKKIYDATFLDKTQQGPHKKELQNLLARSQVLQKRLTERQDKDGDSTLAVPLQPDTNLPKMLTRVWAAVPAFKAKVTSALPDLEPHRFVFRSTLKKTYRILEKSTLRNPVKTLDANEADVSRVLDMYGVLIVVLDYGQMTRVLDDLFADGELVILRVKDRHANPTIGGWRDFVLTCEFDGVLFEIQICHHEMLKCRKGLDAHEAYAEFRALFEFLELLDIGMSADDFAASISGASWKVVSLQGKLAQAKAKAATLARENKKLVAENATLRDMCRAETENLGDATGRRSADTDTVPLRDQSVELGNLREENRALATDLESARAQVAELQSSQAKVPATGSGGNAPRGRGAKKAGGTSSICSIQ